MKKHSWNARSANISAVFLLNYYSHLLIYIRVVLRTCTRTLRKAFDIQRFKSNKKTSRLHMAVLCKAMLCVLDAEIWIIRVLHVSFKEETFPRCEPRSRFNRRLSFRKKMYCAVICFMLQKKKRIIYIASSF